MLCHPDVVTRGIDYTSVQSLQSKGSYLRFMFPEVKILKYTLLEFAPCM